MPGARALIVAVAVTGWTTACRPDGARPRDADRLADHLRAIRDARPSDRASLTLGWRLDRAAWTRTVVAPYDTVHAAYVHEFEAVVTTLAAQLAAATSITTHRHLAGDPRLTRGQAQARWALPVLAPTEVAELDGAPLDAVFVRDGDHWRAIVGLDVVIHARAAAIDPTCSHYLEATMLGRCGEIGWVLADAALRADPTRFAHACKLAENLCAP